MISLPEQLAAAQRELGKRQALYPRFIDQGKLTPAKAAHEIACMEAIIHTLQRQCLLQEVSNEIKDQCPNKFFLHERTTNHE